MYKRSQAQRTAAPSGQVQSGRFYNHVPGYNPQSTAPVLPVQNNYPQSVQQPVNTAPAPANASFPANAAQQPASAPVNMAQKYASAPASASAPQHNLQQVNKTAAANTSQQQSPQADNFLNQKIFKINGNKKVIDFNSKLTMALIHDFANVHGCGGSGHAGNSTIGIVICDYSKGTGENVSTTVQFNLDVEDIGFLYEAAMAARLGMLKPDPGLNKDWLEQSMRILESFKSLPRNPDGSRAIPAQALNDLNGSLINAMGATNTLLSAPVFSYFREKNNPYAVKNGLAPCSKITISCSPYRKDGTLSKYPWYIAVENFDAPLSVGKNGSSSHNSTQAANKRSAFINVSNDDFCAAMVAVKRFISLWEHRAIPMMNEAYNRIAANRAAVNK